MSESLSEPVEISVDTVPSVVTEGGNEKEKVSEHASSQKSELILTAEKFLTSGITTAKQTVNTTLENLSNNTAISNIHELVATAAQSLQSEKDREIEQLQQQLLGMEILLQQNAALEREVSRLCSELDDASSGLQKRGYLFKWNDREIYYTSKWALRYFVLHGNQLAYYADEQDNRPRRTLNLSKCFVKSEGVKKNGSFYVFSIYLGDVNDETQEASLLLKMSSDSAAEAMLWIDMLEKACALKDNKQNVSTSPSVRALAVDQDEGAQHVGLELNVDASGRETDPVSSLSFSTKGLPALSAQDPSLSTSPLSIVPPVVDDALGPVKSGFASAMLQRVQSTNRILQRSLSRQRVAPTSPMPSKEVNAASAAALAKKAKLRRQIKAFPGYKPMHTVSAPSPLSGEVRRGEYSFRGFFNLGVIILVVTHCDLIVNNLAKYGFKFSLLSFLRPPSEFVAPDLDKVLLIHSQRAILTWFLSMFLALSVEKIANRFEINERLVLCINFALGTFNLLMPCYWVWTSMAHPGANLAYLFQSVIIWMKLVSYAHANKDLRVANRRAKMLDKDGSRSGYSSGEELAMDNNAKPPADVALKTISEVKDLQPPFLLYPQNISLGNLMYFMVVPTLCYQLNYPRSPSIRWNKVAFLIARMIFAAVVMLYSVEQYMQPTLETAVEPMHKRNALAVLERLLKLSIPSTYVWLLGFYFYFHCWLNLLAELTRFGDRMFYKDWWNAKTIDRYWRTWNMPVHHWITRHLYYPLLRVGCNKVTATFVVFAFSAAMHELVISLPFQYISFHAFVGMMAQAPLIFFANYVDRMFDNPFLGNALFWCSFCIFGQPMAVMLYYYEIVKMSVHPH